MASNPTLKSVWGHICFHTHTNRAAHMQKSICLITTGVSQEIKKPPWIKSLELNIREVQSSALTEKKANHYLPERGGKNQRLKAAGCDTEEERHHVARKTD